MTVSTALVPTDNLAAVEALDPAAQEVAVTGMLSEARSWLAHAVEASEPATSANFKAWVATIAETTKQLGLSKGIQLDAQEMVRRAEHGAALAIRKGQAEGTVETPHEAAARAVLTREVNQGRADPVALQTSIKPKPLDFVSHSEWTNHKGSIADLVDGVSPEQFEGALAEAKAEENPSRANVVRKIKDQDAAGFQTRRQRADLITELAAQGYSSRQMPKRVGVSEETVRQIARDFNIDIPADKIIGRTRRLDHTRMVESTVTALGDLVSAINLIDFAEVDPAEATKWAISLNDSIRALNRFNKQIKEIAPND